MAMRVFSFIRGALRSIVRAATSLTHDGEGS